MIEGSLLKKFGTNFVQKNLQLALSVIYYNDGTIINKLSLISYPEKRIHPIHNSHHIFFYLKVRLYDSPVALLNLVPTDFILFLKLRISMKGFKDVEMLFKKKMTEILKIKNNVHSGQFRGYEKYSKNCIERGEKYVEN